MAFSLAFSQAPPDHPFVGEYFPVQLTLIDADHEIHGGIELPLSLELYYEEKDKQVSKGVFEVEGSKAPKITKNGMCTCKLHITKSSMELDNRRFVLKASAKMKNGSKLEVWSEPLRVMRYRLVIEEGGILEHDEAETRKMKDAAAARCPASVLDSGAVRTASGSLLVRGRIPLRRASMASRRRRCDDTVRAAPRLPGRASMPPRRHRRAAAATPSTRRLDAIDAPQPRYPIDAPSTRRHRRRRRNANAGLVQGRGRPREVYITEHLVGGRVRLQD